MGSADAYGVGVHLCDYSQQLASLQDRNSAGVCRNKLGIILHNGSRADYQVSTLDIVSALTQKHLNSHRPYSL